MFEKFLTLFERLVVALEGASKPSVTVAPAARGKGKAVEATAPPEPEGGDDFLGSAAPDVTYTVDQVREALVAYGAKHSQDKARAILLKHGKVKTLQELKLENFAAVIDAAKL